MWWYLWRKIINRPTARELRRYYDDAGRLARWHGFHSAAPVEYVEEALRAERGWQVRA